MQHTLMPTMQLRVRCSSGGLSQYSGLPPAADSSRSRVVRQRVRSPLEAMVVTVSSSTARMSSIRGTATPLGSITFTHRRSTISAAPCHAPDIQVKNMPQSPSSTSHPCGSRAAAGPQVQPIACSARSRRQWGQGTP